MAGFCGGSLRMAATGFTRVGIQAKLEDIECFLEFPPINRISASDGAEMSNPTPVQAFDFLAEHRNEDVIIPYG